MIKTLFYSFLIISLYQVPFELIDVSGTISKLLIVVTGLLTLLLVILERQNKLRFPFLPAFVALVLVTFLPSFFSSTVSTWLSLFLPVFVGYSTYLIIINHRFTENEYKNISKFMFITMLMQIVASIMKVVFWGVNEKSAGTIHFLAGGLNTILPLVFIAIVISLYLIYKRSSFFLFLVPGFLFMAWAGDKRGIYFYLPVVSIVMYTLYSMYERGKLDFSFYARTFFFVIIPVMIIFYFGVRLQPTLNRENIFWGSFDIDYVMDYASDYSTRYNAENQASGRFASYIEIIDNFMNNKDVDQLFFGYGSSSVIGVTEEEFRFFKNTFNVSQTLGLSGFTTYLIAHGILGVSLLMIFLGSIIKRTFKIHKAIVHDKMQRALNFGTLIVSIIYLMDFFTYSKSTITVYGTMVIFFYLHGTNHRYVINQVSRRVK